MYDNKSMILDDIVPLLDRWEVRESRKTMSHTHRDDFPLQKEKNEEQAHFILARLLKWKTEWYRETGAFTQ
jgi:hypothetical protein